MIIVFFILVATLGLQELSAPAGYRGIVPLKSTRADVERLFGLPRSADQSAYYFRNEIVSIQYAKYGCNPPPRVEGWPIPPLEGWQVPPDTVLVVRVNLRKQIPLKNLAVDLNTFKKVRGDPDVASHFLYVDDERGLTINLNGDGAAEIVRGYIYEPEAKYKDLRCPGQTQY